MPSLLNDTAAAVVILNKGTQQFFFNGKKTNATSLFEIGSVSKPFFALLASKLVKEKVWSLDMPMSTILGSNFKHHSYTLQQLLTHTSGLPRLPGQFQPSDISDPYRDFDNKALNNALALPFSGTGQYEYSNFGYGILGWSMAKQFQQSQAQMIQQHLFTPLKMDNAKLALVDIESPRRLIGQDYYGEAVANWHFDSLLGAGGVLASAQDMAHWISRYWLHKDLNKTLQNSMENSLSRLSDTMAYGWNKGQGSSYFHGGQTAGFNTMVVFDPIQQQAVIALIAGTHDAASIAMPLFQQLQTKQQ